MTEGNNADVKLALDEMQLNMEKGISAGDALDQKANTLLTAASLMLAIATTLQISISPNRSVYFWVALIFVLILYTGVIILILHISMPQTYHLPLKADWEELDNQLFGKTEREVILVILSGYVEQVAYNELLNKIKAKFYTRSYWMLILIIIALLVLTRIP